MNVVIFSIDELHKSMISHEPKKPPSMKAVLRPTKAEPKDAVTPKVTHSSAPKVGRAFRIRRKLGPEAKKERAAEERTSIKLTGLNEKSGF